MSKFVWAPRKAESDMHYVLRAFSENNISVKDIWLAKARAEEAKIGKPLEYLPPHGPAPRKDARELELEKEVAALKLDNGQLVKRLAMFQRMVRDLHEERAEMYRWMGKLD